MRLVLLLFALPVIGTAPAAAEEPAAAVRVDRLELISRMRSGGAAPRLLSRADLDLIVATGAPFAADFGLQLDYDDTEDRIFFEDLSPADPRLGLRYARLRIVEPAGAPLELGYFVGEPLRFGSGLDFARRFNTGDFATHYRGYLYFPTGPEYEGLHAVSGTGTSVATTASLWPNADLSLFAYQDTALGPERYATDLRYRLNLEHIKLDAFAGASFPEGEFGRYRAGAMAYVSSPGPGSFFAQAGLLQWEPPDEIDLDDLFFLFEPRLRFQPLALIFTFFSHPGVYRHEETVLARRMDVSGRIQLEELVDGLITTGVESTVEIDPDADDKAVTRLGPLFELNASGVRWLFKLNAQLYPYDLLDGLEAVFAARTTF